jgi:uncharacterized protein (DUF2225 family)
MFQCPKCKSTNIDVTIRTQARLIQEDDELETSYGEASDCDHFWDENSCMTCRDCHYNARSSHFDGLRTARVLEKNTTREERQLISNAIYISIADLENPANGRGKEWCDIRAEEYRELAKKLGVNPED